MQKITKEYKAIFYDIDGTLLNTMDMNLYPLIRIIEEEKGERLTYEEVVPFAAYPGMETLEKLQIPDRETVYARWVKYVNEYPGGAVVYDGVADVLKTLHPHLLQAVVSAKTRQQYEIDFVQNGLHRYIDTAVLCEDTKNHKPDPEPLLEGLKRLGLQAEEVLYIGDTCSDYKAAISAGIDFGYAKWGSFSDAGITAPEYVLERPQDLYKVVGRKIFI